ncbi:MAG: DEAD/DEAH box helicase family protein [Bacteroidota bacterium]|nr:DEAD/DEAH box helicase family protein [Bacteroidota bacterium]
MKNLDGTKKLIKLHEDNLEKNEQKLSQNPKSLFYKGIVKNTKERIDELKSYTNGNEFNRTDEFKKPPRINEATSTDLKVIKQLEKLGWNSGFTLLYQQEYQLTPEQQKEYNKKSIKPDIVLQDINGNILAVFENKLEDEKKGLNKLRMIYSKILNPRFLYACSKEKILFYDNSWKGIDAGDFRQVTDFMSLDEMKIKVGQEKRKAEIKEIFIDKTIAGGYDKNVDKVRYYQEDCIMTLIENYKNNKQKMLIHMATGLGKTRMSVALVKALLQSGLAKRVLFVVDRVLLAQQAMNKGFSLISKEYPSTRLRTSNYKQQKHTNIHVVVIDSLEMIFSDIPSNFYDLIIVDECHRSMTINRKVIFDHFLCPRIGLTATPRAAIAKEGDQIPEEDLAILDTYKLFGCETGEPDYKFDLERGIDEGFLAPYKPIEIITPLIQEAKKEGIKFEYVMEPENRERIDLPEEKKLKVEQLNRKFIAENNCKRIAEELKKNTEYMEKVIVFGVSQAHCMELAKSINEVFETDKTEKPYYAEAIISENNELNETLKNWFEKPYKKPFIVTSVDIMSTGVDIPCVRYIAFASLTKSVGKYIQMLGRGTRIDKDTGKYSFTILDFVGLCKLMDDNGKGTKKENKKIVGKESGRTGGKVSNPKGEYFLIDNPDPSMFIQRVSIHGDEIKVIDNKPIPLDEAKKIFEEGLMKSKDKEITELKENVVDKKYEPTQEQLEILLRWLREPDIYLDEGQLQKIYNYPEGSIWDFVLQALGIRKIPTIKERIEKGYLAYLHTYNFTDNQIRVLKKLKNTFASNAESKKELTANDIFGNPVYSKLIGDKKEIEKIFEGRFEKVFSDMKENIGQKTIY